MADAAPQSSSWERDFGDAAKAAREARHWTQKRLAKEAGVSKRTVEHLERGRGVRIETLRRVCIALNLSLPELLSSPGTRSSRRGAVSPSAAFSNEDATLITELAKQNSVADILRLLLGIASQCGLSKLRYYQYYPAEKTLRSIESAGHDDDAAFALLFRSGGFFMHADSCPRDSFMCLQVRDPVMCQLDPLAPDGEAGFERPEGIRHIVYVKQEQFDRLTHRSGLWIDIPLEACGQVCGKLSCDVSSDPPELLAVGRFWRLTQIAAPLLEVARRLEMTVPPKKLIETDKKLEPCKSLSELNDLCVNDIAPSLCECTYSSLLTVSEDSLKRRKLILRTTSYPQSQQHENLPTGVYPLDDAADQTITTSIVFSGSARRYQDLNDPARLEHQLKAYGGPVRWQHRLLDSDNNSSFLGVPLRMPGCDTLGVLRLTEKKTSRGGVYFTERDEHVLQTVVEGCVVPRLLVIRERCVAEILTRNTGLLLKLASSNSRTVASCLIDAMKEFFPERGSSKLYLVNVLVGASRFRHDRIDGRLSAEAEKDSDYDCAGTMTGYALRSSVAGTVFFNDLEYAAKSGAFRQIAPSAVCALACRISSEEDHGVVIVESDHYDLSQEIEGQLLGILAGIAGGVYAETRHQRVSSRLPKP